MIWIGERFVSIGMFYRRTPEAMPYTICVAVGVLVIAAMVAFH